MWSFIKCEESPPHIISNKPFNLDFRVAHICFLKRKKLFFKLYLDGNKVYETFEDRFIWLVYVTDYRLYNLITESTEGVVNIKVVVGYCL